MLAFRGLAPDPRLKDTTMPHHPRQAPTPPQPSVRTQAAGSPARARRSLRAALTAPLVALCGLALMTTVAAPAHASDYYSFSKTFPTPAADVVTKFEISQDRTPDSNGNCGIVSELTWEVNGATSSTQENNLEAAMVRAVDTSNSYLKGLPGIYTNGNNAQTYYTGKYCSDVSDTDVQRRLGSMSSLGRYFAAVAAGIAADAITAGLMIVGASYVAPEFAATKTFAFLVGCVAGAMGTFVGQKVAGSPNINLLATLIACVTEGSTGVALKKVANWVAGRGFKAQLAAVRDEGAEIIPDAVADQMVKALKALGTA